jgi:membrane-associated phospholipid phosphatase
MSLSKSNSTASLSFLLLALLFFIKITTVNAQNPVPFNYPDQPNGKYFGTYLTATISLVTSPTNWNKNQWIAVGGIAATGVLLYVYDDQIRDFFQKNKNNTLNQISKYGVEPWGSGLYPALMMGSFYVYGLAAHSPRARQIALGGTQAWVMSALTVTVIKHLTHRHRPDQDTPADPHLWEGPFQGFEYTSFPSGHTITAFSLASFLSSVYRDKPWVGIFSYAVATGVGLSRIYDDQHWSSDVFIGAALGYAIGKMVFKLMDPQSGVSMQVGNRGTIGLVYRF